MEYLSHEQILSRLTAGQGIVEVDAEYLHVKSGVTYTVAGLIFQESDMNLLVAYYDPYTADVTFSRPIDEFIEKFQKIE